MTSWLLRFFFYSFYEDLDISTYHHYLILHVRETGREGDLVRARKSVISEFKVSQTAVTQTRPEGMFPSVSVIKKEEKNSGL